MILLDSMSDKIQLRIPGTIIAINYYKTNKGNYRIVYFPVQKNILSAKIPEKILLLIINSLLPNHAFRRGTFWNLVYFFVTRKLN